MALFLGYGATALGGEKILKEVIVTLDYEQLTKSLPHLPTGSLVIDYLIGGEPNSFGTRPCPGLPKKRISQVWGHESAGKTTLALTAAATTCANGGTVIYIDWENDIVPDYAAALGVPITDPNKFILLQPDTLEDGVKLAMAACKAGISLIVFDSVGAGVPARQVNRDITLVAEQTRVGEMQVVWSQELPNLKSAANKSGTHIMGISQIRAKINTGGSMGGPTTQPQGGNAWKFYASVRLELRRIKQEKGKEHNVLTHKMDERVIGGIIRCKVIKCKLSRSQGREEKFYIRWGEGIDDLRTVLEIGIAHGLVKRSGSWLTWNSPKGEVKYQGTNQFRKYLIENEDQFDSLYQKVIPFLGTAKVAEEELEDLPEDVEELMGAALLEELSEGPDLSEGAPAETAPA
jgi:recombination protein RecA